MVRTLLNEVFLGGNKQECIKTQSSIETTVIGQRLLTNIYRPLKSLSKKIEKSIMGIGKHQEKTMSQWGTWSVSY